ncbi:MAG: glycosyltransferase, partial [Candidatus Eisenbacteria bacterium]|nr:glycosyltransferase [Candidatus Eisenbacteria bacterium]
MRILHVIKIGGLAGAEKHVLELVDALRTQGLDARICVLADPAVPIDDVYEEIRRRGIPFETFPARKRLNWAVRRHLIDEFRRVRPDIVHTHLIHADFYAVPAARRAEVPAVVSTRHDQLGFRRRWSLRALNRWLL